MAKAGAASQGKFSEENRVRIVDAFLGDNVIDPAEAWKDVYRLLLWVDPRTGIAHCYESDKSQPGRAWYPRSIEFHRWVADQLGVEPIDLKDHIDRMFREVLEEVIPAEADQMAEEAREAQQGLVDERHPMPVPGDDPRLLEIVERLMPLDPSERLSEDAVKGILREIYAHMGSEKKRANLLGRGFENVLDGVIGRLSAPPAEHGPQRTIETIPGFRPTRDGEKVEKVDVFVGDGRRTRIMISAKWSVRADREKQMEADLQTYIHANEWGRDVFDYVWITNEFDPARLVANATKTQNNQLQFTRIVHVCPQALALVHRLDGARRLGKTPALLKEQLAEGRIVGLDSFLREISGQA